MKIFKYKLDCLGITPMGVFKYQLDPTQMEIEMPVGARLLCIQTQKGIPCLWAQVNESNQMTKRYFKTYGTGHDLPDFPGDYVGTYQLFGGDLVFHVYEISKP